MQVDLNLDHPNNPRQSNNYDQVDHRLQYFDGNNFNHSNSMASFKDVPITQRIPDEFEYQYGKESNFVETKHGGSISSRDFILMRDCEPSYIFNEHPSMYSSTVV